jgi:hypothetical protein
MSSLGFVCEDNEWGAARESTGRFYAKCGASRIIGRRFRLLRAFNAIFIYSMELRWFDLSTAVHLVLLVVGRIQNGLK